MAEATGTVTNWDSSTTSKKLVETIGSFAPVSMLKYVPSTADDTAGTVDLTLTGLSLIIGWNITFIISGVMDADNDAAVSISGNVMTIADGGANYALSTNDQIFITAWGKPRA